MVNGNEERQEEAGRVIDDSLTVPVAHSSQSMQVGEEKYTYCSATTDNILIPAVMTNVRC